jgi:hypothetical protein
LKAVAASPENAEQKLTGENLMKKGLKPKTPTKAQKISRAMQAYMERAQSHGKTVTDACIKNLSFLLEQFCCFNLSYDRMAAQTTIPGAVCKSWGYHS